MDKDVLQHRESEQQVIGSLMVDTTAIPTAIEILGIVPEVFFTMDHQLIYNAIVTLHGKHKSTNAVAVSEYLDRHNDLQRAGGDEYLGDLYTRIVETESTAYYCEIIQERYLRRQYRDAARKIMEKSNDLTTPIDDLIEFYADSQKSINSQRVAKSIDTITALDIDSTEFESVPEIVPGLMRQGLVLCAGQPKVGKSYAMLNLALAACQGRGGRVWNEFIMEDTYNTLYIALESDYDELKERFSQLLCDEPVPSNLHFLKMDDDDYTGFKLNTQGLNMLARTIMENDISLVIVDTWQRAKPLEEVKGNAYEQDSILLAPISSMVKQLGITMILVHHTRKARDETNLMNEISGSVGLQSIPDSIMIMKNMEENEKSVFMQSRRMPDKKFGLEINIHSPGVVKYRELEAAEMPKTPISKLIIDCFTNDDEKLSTDVITERIGKTKEQVKMPLKRLTDRGELRRVSHGIYRLVGVDEEILF